MAYVSGCSIAGIDVHESAIATACALTAQRWVRVTNFAALALLFGWLSAGCNSAAQIPGTPRGTYTVTITGTSGMTTNTVQVKLVVK
jgi:hypothetical protein